MSRLWAQKKNTFGVQSVQFRAACFDQPFGRVEQITPDVGVEDELAKR